MMASSSKPGIKSLLQKGTFKADEKSESYLRCQEENQGDDGKKKGGEKMKTMVNDFYDVATDFYEYGWGDSFHFYTIDKGASARDAIVKHQIFLAMKLALTPQDTVLDMGCGVGGPARTIARFSKAKIVGVNNNDYQLQRADILTGKAKLSHLCTFVKGDFTKLSQEADSFDKAYSFEATCHALKKTEPYGEAYRILKPGGLFAIYEWVLKADKYDPKKPEHVKISEDIQFGNGLPTLDTDVATLEAMRSVGFEIVESEDIALTSEVPWETPLEPGLMNFKATPLGRTATHSMLFCLEKLGLSPKGSTKVHSVLCKGADALIKGAKSEIFTPMFYVLARKPVESK